MTRRMITALGIIGLSLEAVFLWGCQNRRQVELPVETRIEVEEERLVYYDVPLSIDLQNFIFRNCEEEGIPSALVMAIIDVESNFETNAVSNTDDYGLMQINQCNFEWLEETMGLTDIMDPRQNVYAGIKLLSSFYHEYLDAHDVALAYHLGESGLKAAHDSGIYSTPYSEEVVTKWQMYTAEYELKRLHNEQ